MGFAALEPLIYTHGLIFLRLSCLFLLVPPFQAQAIPQRAKVALSFWMTTLLGSLIAKDLFPVPESLLVFAEQMGREVAVGVFLGSVVRLSFQALETAGTIMAQQLTLSNAEIFNPHMDTKGSLTGSLIGVAALAFIVSTDVHHVFIQGIVYSYKIFPLRGELFIEDFSMSFLNHLSEAFTLAIRIASPTLVIGTVFLVAAGLLNRLMPQMMVFFVVQPAQLLLLLFVCMLSIPFGLQLFADRIVLVFSRILGV